MKKLLKFVGIFLGFIALVFVLVMFLTNGATKVIDQQNAYLADGNTKEAYGLFSKEAKNQYSYEEYEKFVKDYPIFSQVKEVSYSSREISGDVATMIGTITGEDGAVFPIRYDLVKEDGEWRVYSITGE